MSLVQYNQMVVVTNFVDQVRGPQHTDAILGYQLPHVAQDIGSRIDVETNSWFIKNQEAGTVQQGAGNLDAPHMSPRKVANLVIGAIFERYAHEHFIRAGLCLTPANSMKGRVIHQVLHDREIEIERAGLEHDTENAQGFPGGALHIVAKDPDASMPRGI